MNWSFRVYAMVILALLAAPAAAVAQQLSISGTVDDTYGVVAAASVELRNQAGAVQKTTADGEGRYHFDALQAGAYEVSVARDGFSRAARTVTLTTQSRPSI